MSDDRTPLPPVPSGKADERTTLIEFLDYHRVVLLRKAEGISDEDGRRALCPPSEMSVMGIVRHMADVERSWFRNAIAPGEGLGPIYYGDGHPTGDPDGDFHPGPGDTMAEAIATWHAEVEIARANLAGAALDDLSVPRSSDGAQASVRWIVVHMIEEYARHCGHLDLLREAIDGVVDD